MLANKIAEEVTGISSWQTQLSKSALFLHFFLPCHSTLRAKGRGRGCGHKGRRAVLTALDFALPLARKSLWEPGLELWQAGTANCCLIRGLVTWTPQVAFFFHF